jgi:hypothetical protein
MVRASSHVLYLFSVVESTEPNQVYVDKLVFVSERTIKDTIIIRGATGNEDSRQHELPEMMMSFICSCRNKK